LALTGHQNVIFVSSRAKVLLCTSKIKCVIIEYRIEIWYCVQRKQTRALINKTTKDWPIRVITATWTDKKLENYIYNPSN
jgi:hypothetical protein